MSKHPYHTSKARKARRLVQLQERIDRYEFVLVSYEDYPDEEAETVYKELLEIDRKALSLGL